MLKLFILLKALLLPYLFFERGGMCEQTCLLTGAKSSGVLGRACLEKFVSKDIPLMPLEFEFAS